jgi:hypothetical protein
VLQMRFLLQLIGKGVTIALINKMMVVVIKHIINRYFLLRASSTPTFKQFIPSLVAFIAFYGWLVVPRSSGKL